MAMAHHAIPVASDGSGLTSALCAGGQGVSQPSLKDRAFSTFLDQNPPFELRPEFASDRSLFRQWPVIEPRAQNAAERAWLGSQDAQTFSRWMGTALTNPDNGQVTNVLWQAGHDWRSGPMGGDSTTIGGIVIPSTDPVFLAVVIGIHIPLGIACVITGVGAMLCRKGRGQHSSRGTIYFWCLTALFASAAFLSIVRWSENYHLFILGAAALGFAWFGRSALQHRWPNSVRLHITGMGMSYVVMLIAFYVDNGKQLPLWKDLPSFMYWLLPLAIGTPLIARAVLWHPLARQSQLDDQKR
jgi:hypothetical protein